ncbi:hypothetical protein JCM11641_002618 [Rhodosporidiobolus odoratus]
MLRLGSLQRKNRLTVLIIIPLAALIFIVYKSSFTSSSGLTYPHGVNNLAAQAHIGSGALGDATGRAARRKNRGGPQAIASLLDKLVKVPEEEVGKIAICASIHNEGRFLTEWLLYHRAVGVDRFYLFDTGSTDETLSVLQPWLESETVKLHRFNHDQGGNFQLNSLETCSRTYASQTEWLLDADIDEFYVVPSSLTSHSHSRPLLPDEIPVRPLWRLLDENWLYKAADVVAANRVTWKNSGYKLLPEEASVLVSQTLRDFYHSIHYDKLEFTKSLVHTKQESGWIIPGAHFVKHNTLAKGDAKIITVDGKPIQPLDLHEGEKVEKKGTLYKGHVQTRAFEPLVMWHYVERDLENCLAKLRRASVVRKGGWRDKAGEEGCKSYELYQPDDEWVAIHEKDSFYGGAVKDLTMANSWYGQFLPTLISASLARAKTLSAVANGNEKKLPFQPKYTNPHPELIAEWKKKGFGLQWGESPSMKEARLKAEAKEKALNRRI